MDIIDRVKTFEDACEVLGVNPEEYKVSVPVFSVHHSKALLAHMKLVVIAEVLNEGWKPEWSDGGEGKYYPWFNMGYPLGVELSYHSYGNWPRYSSISSRLCFKSRELAEYAGKQFEDLYKDYFEI